MLKKLSKTSKLIANMSKVIFSFCISQSDKMSESYQKHRERVTQVELLKQYLSGEIQTRESIKKSLLEKFIDATPEEKIRIESDLEFVEQRNNQFKIYLKSLSYESQNINNSHQSQLLIKDHWIDKFNELARKRNEEWRSELLARALAFEAENPGRISPRALWLIGNLEEDLFEALSNLLGHCIWVGSSPFFPDLKITLPNTKETFGELAFRLSDIGVLADSVSSAKQLSENHSHIVRYNKTQYRIITKEKIVVQGLLFTPLGEVIAQFFEPDANQEGVSWSNPQKCSI